MPEFSFTNPPMLPIADQTMAWSKSSAIKRIKEFTKTGNEPNKEFAKAFFVIDGDPKSFSSYKLPYADIVDDNLVAVPRAIFSIAGILNGSRSKTDLPSSDYANVKRIITRYYKKIAEENNDKDLKAPFNIHTEKENKDEVETEKFNFDFSTNDDEPEILGNSAIYSNCKIFEAGDYSDKNFSLNTDEMDDAISEFSPVDVDIEHDSSPIDGEIGQLVEIFRVGDELLGTVVLSVNFNNMLKPGKKKLSATWTFNKKLVGLASVLHPRISDASLTPIFSEKEPKLADTKTKIPYEKNPHQKIHDIAVAQGAECCNGFSEEGKKYAEFLTPQQLKAIQKHHDMAVADGAFCSDYQDRVKSGLNVHKARMGYMSDFKKDELSDEAKAAFSKLEADLNAAEKEKAELSKKVESLETEFSSTQKELTESQTKFSETQSTFSATQADFTAKLKVLEDTLTQFGKENEQLLAAKEASEKTALISEAKSYFAEKRDAFVLTANEAEKHFARVSEDPSLFSTIKSILDIQEPRKELAPVGKLTNSFSKFRDQNINNGDENPLQTLNKFCMDEDNKKKYGGFAGVHEHLRATNDPIFVNAMENYK